MISEKLQIALNKQINAEMWSSYFYLAISCKFKEKGLDGFASWMKAQADEEMSHAHKMMQYIIDRDGSVKFEAIKEATVDFKCPKEAFEKAFAHEKVVTGSVNDLLTLAIAEKDYATENLLRWFVDEQVEEEATFKGIVEALAMIKDDAFAIYSFSNKLGERK